MDARVQVPHHALGNWVSPVAHQKVVDLPTFLGRLQFLQKELASVYKVGVRHSVHECLQGPVYRHDGGGAEVGPALSLGQDRHQY